MSENYPPFYLYGFFFGSRSWKSGDSDVLFSSLVIAMARPISLLSLLCDLRSLCARIEYRLILMMMRSHLRRAAT